MSRDSTGMQMIGVLLEVGERLEYNRTAGVTIMNSMHADR